MATAEVTPQTKRIRGDGSTYLRGGTWWVAFYSNGRLIRESAKTGDPDEAERYLRKCLKRAHIAEGTGAEFETAKLRKRMISDLFAELKKDLSIRGKLYMQSISNLKRAEADFGMYRANTLTAKAVDAYIEERLAAGHRPSSINKVTQLLKQAYKFAGLPAPRIRKLSEVGNERLGFFETADFEAVAGHLPEHLKDFARWGFTSGWRKNSIRQLRWEDVGEEVVYLRAVNSKTRKPESIPIVGELHDIIDRRRAARVFETENGEAHFSEFVFHHDGEQIRDFRKSWKSACRAAGVDGRLFHDFRRTAARNLVRAGVPIPVAMKITGHRTDSVFRRYAIVSEEQKAQALTQAAAYLRAEREKKVAVMTAAK